MFSTGLKTYRVVAILHSKYGVDIQTDQGIEAISFLTQRNPSQGLVERKAFFEGYDPADWDVTNWYASEYKGEINLETIRQFSSKESQAIFFNEEVV